MKWKLKDNIQFEELEKYGYHKGLDDGCHKAYIKDLKYNDYIAIYEDRTILIDIEDFCGNDWDKYVEKLLGDLIQAQIIEKVSD